jgi:hypothetical protein
MSWFWDSSPIDNEATEFWGRRREFKFRQDIKDRMETFHMKFKLDGTSEQIDLFHAMIAASDKDYPLDPFRSQWRKIMKCSKCEGWIWRMCLCGPSDLARAARQVGLKFEMKGWKREAKCHGKPIEVEPGKVFGFEGT